MVVMTFLAVEFIDELVGGVGSAAWPLIRNDLDLTYVQIGLLFTVLGIVSSFIVPFIGILGAVVAFAVSLDLVSISQGFFTLLAAWVIFPLAGGAFVSLSQGSLMDLDSLRHEHNMVRWQLSGSVVNVIGPLALAASSTLGLGWRGMFLSIAILMILAVSVTCRIPLKYADRERHGEVSSFVAGLVNAVKALRRFGVIRWLVPSRRRAPCSTLWASPSRRPR